MSILCREAEASKFHFGGCPGASGKLASRDMFRALLSSSWSGNHKFTPDDDFFGFLDRRRAGGRKFLTSWVETRLEAVNYEHPGSRSNWRL